jgi:hypothetical protein
VDVHQQVRDIEAAIEWARTLPMTVDYDQLVRVAGYRLRQARLPPSSTSGIPAHPGDLELVLAAWHEKERQVDLRLARAHNYFGRPGSRDRIRVTGLTVSRVHHGVGEWGSRTYYFFRHDDGRLVRWLQSSGKPIDLKVGERVVVEGRVKEHQAAGQEPITVMTYVQVEK